MTLALGGESVNDTYYPFGRCNMLEVAFVCAHTLWMMAPEHHGLLYDMITVGPARIIGLRRKTARYSPTTAVPVSEMPAKA